MASRRTTRRSSGRKAGILSVLTGAGLSLRSPAGGWPLVLGLPLGLGGVALAWLGLQVGPVYDGLLERYAELVEPFAAAGVGETIWLLKVMTQAVAVFWLVASVLALLWRHRLSLSIVRKACVAGYALFGLYAWAVFSATGIIADQQIQPGGIKVDGVIAFQWQWAWLWPAGLALLVVAVVHLGAWLSQAVGAFEGSSPEEPTAGDQVLEEARMHGVIKAVGVGAVIGAISGVFVGHDRAMAWSADTMAWAQAAGVAGPLVRAGIWIGLALMGATILAGVFALVAAGLFAVSVLAGGRDHRYGQSVYSSVWTHLLVIVLIPWLLNMTGCVQPYRIPEGSGNPVMELVQVVKPKKKKKKKLVVNPNSAILYQRPDLFGEIQEQVKEETELTHQADANRVHGGKLGEGGGDEGGWPDGVGDDPIRFIRLKINVRGWDDGMQNTADARADLNLLDYLKNQTGFKVARTTEAIRIHDLRRFPPGFAPPFVYLTGDASFHVSRSQAEVLREYLMGGGMLFADAGSPGFHGSFKAFIENSVFPGESMRQIADDDPIHRLPNSLPHGPPPLFHHGGYQPLGVKKKGRWMVYYHPGDLGDAWESGHSGVNPKLAERAYAVGVNVIAYSFTHYLRETREHRQ